MAKYDLGCGGASLPGFIGIDVGASKRKNYIQWNLHEGLPSQCKDAEMFTSCHFFEHLTSSEALKLMKECYKYLKPEGIFRLGVPCFKRLVEHYLKDDWDHWDIYFPQICALYPNEKIRSIIDVCEDGVYQYSSNQFQTHKSLWDLTKSIKYLTYAGFKDVKEVPYDHSIDPPGEMRSRYTIVIQGIK